MLLNRLLLNSDNNDYNKLRMQIVPVIYLTTFMNIHAQLYLGMGKWLISGLSQGETA